MSEDVDVDLREQTFHNAVREVIVSIRGLSKNFFLLRFRMNDADIN